MARRKPVPRRSKRSRTRSSGADAGGSRAGRFRPVERATCQTRPIWGSRRFPRFELGVAAAVDGGRKSAPSFLHSGLHQPTIISPARGFFLRVLSTAGLLLAWLVGPDRAAAWSDARLCVAQPPETAPRSYLDADALMCQPESYYS